MKIASKLAFAFFFAACSCLALFSVLAANHEATRVEKLATSGLVAAGAGLRMAIEETWSAQGFAAADEIASGFRPDSEVRARLVETKRGEEPPAGAPRVTLTPAPGGRYLRVELAVEGPDAHAGTLELTRVIESRATVLRAELPDELFAVFSLAVTMAAIAAVLGVVLIGRPVARLIAQTRRIGAGDLSQRLDSPGRDELADLACELDAMCDRLDDAGSPPSGSS